ncbi:MAG: GNAT family N-acetyltransferase [Cyanosarcina radialis HA8281-LM2]|jgi:ribosomal protein S18 acetylase RimI-like enzyme|nr:GNAT family N-acetyltransferase [Cyanosarcina radialis HA8281-LM2]
MNEKLIKRILTQAQVPDLLAVLADRLSQSDLQSLLLEVYRSRSQSLTPQHLLQQYEQNRLVQPAAVSPKQLLEFDRLAYSVLPPSFEPLELSPVCPLGTNSIVTPLDQNQTVTTIRNSEVCSDSTNVLALECARRRRDRKRRAEGDTKLCASHRLLRPQAPDLPGTFPHFRIFSLVTAGRDRGSYRFEIAALTEHLEFYLRLLQLAQQSGFPLAAIRIQLTIFDEIRSETLKTEVLDKLSPQYAAVELGCTLQRQERSYYTGVRFGIYAKDRTDTEYFLADGGFTDWTQQLLSDRKERLLISGLGSERFISCFETINAAIEVERIQSHQGELLREIRLRALKDAPDAFLENYDRASEQPWEYWQASAHKHATSSQSANFFGFFNGTLAGMVGAYITDDEPRIVNLCAMWVAPEARQQGLGKALVDRVIDWANQASANRVRLWVNQENAIAANFYRRCGFNDTGNTTVFPAKPDAIEREMQYAFSGNTEFIPTQN